MCISNLANESEFLNEISNMENDEGRTLEGYARLNKELESDAQKLAMWDELVSALDTACDRLENAHYQSLHEVLERARAIK